MIRLAFLVDSPCRRAHANVVSRLPLGLLETGQVDTTIVCCGADRPPSWLPPEVRIHCLEWTGVAVSPGLAPQVRSVVTGRCCARCQDVASILVASEFTMMQEKQHKNAARRADGTNGRSPR